MILQVDLLHNKRKQERAVNRNAPSSKTEPRAPWELGSSAQITGTCFFLTLLMNVFDKEDVRIQYFSGISRLYLDNNIG